MKARWPFRATPPLALHLIWLYNKCMDKQQSTTNITIRIPAQIAEVLRKLAKRHDRSLNGEIVRALREYAEQHKNEQ